MGEVPGRIKERWSKLITDDQLMIKLYQFKQTSLLKNVLTLQYKLKYLLEIIKTSNSLGQRVRKTPNSS